MCVHSDHFVRHKHGLWNWVLFRFGFQKSHADSGFALWLAPMKIRWRSPRTGAPRLVGTGPFWASKLLRGMKNQRFSGFWTILNSPGTKTCRFPTDRGALPCGERLWKFVGASHGLNGFPCGERFFVAAVWRKMLFPLTVQYWMTNCGLPIVFIICHRCSLMPARFVGFNY